MIAGACGSICSCSTLEKQKTICDIPHGALPQHDFGELGVTLLKGTVPKHTAVGESRGSSR